MPHDTFGFGMILQNLTLFYIFVGIYISTSHESKSARNVNAEFFFRTTRTTNTDRQTAKQYENKRGQQMLWKNSCIRLECESLMKKKNNMCCCKMLSELRELKIAAHSKMCAYFRFFFNAINVRYGKSIRYRSTYFVE